MENIEQNSIEFSRSAQSHRVLFVIFGIGLLLLVVGGGVWYTIKRNQASRIYNMPLDSDRDLLSDEEELKSGTNPNNHDTDMDGLTDYQEIKLKLDPKNAHSISPEKSDGVITVQNQLEQERQERIKNLQ